MAGALGNAPRLGGRLLAAFALVALPPLLVMAVATSWFVADLSERAARTRVEDGLRATSERIASLKLRAAERVAAGAREVAARPLGTDDVDSESATPLAERLGLPVLEVLDDAGRVISSHHWPAGFGLEDRDRVFPGDDSLREETVAAGYGSQRRLVVSASEPLRRGSRILTVRGGFFLDEAFFGELTALTGVEVGLYDGAGERWVAAPGSPLGTWPPPENGASSGRREVGAVSYRWASTTLHPSVRLLAALPLAEWQAVTRRLRVWTFALSALAMVSAVVAAVVLSRRIASPVRALATGADRVAGGDLEAAVAVPDLRELADLARAFNSMTTELRDTRSRLLQAERVAAWREMARRLAHELKNPLFPIQVSIETLRRALEAGGDGQAFARLFRESSDTILEELASLRRIIDEFSAFARMPRPRLTPTDVNAVVRQVVSLYEARSAPVVIETALAEDLPLVPGDAELLGRALGNLVANALDAINGPGTLRLSTQVVAGGVRIDVSDTGPGLSGEQRDRLFTPYFTTKKGGTGLGLAIVQGIVSDHGGRIEVESEPGRGTTFTLRLPLEANPVEL